MPSPPTFRLFLPSINFACSTAITVFSATYSSCPLIFVSILNLSHGMEDNNCSHKSCLLKALCFSFAAYQGGYKSNFLSTNHKRPSTKKLNLQFIARKNNLPIKEVIRQHSKFLYSYFHYIAYKV